MRKKLVTMITTFTLTLASSITAFAAPEVMPDGGVFDAEYYAQNNPDVVAAFGTDKELLYSHYVNCGKAEGRLPIAQEEYNFGGLTGSNGQLDNPNLDEPYAEGSWYVTLDENGYRVYSLWLVTEIMQSEAFEGLSAEEVILVLDECVSDNYIVNPNDMAMRQELNSLDKNTVQNTLRSVWMKIAAGEYDLSGKEDWELWKR